MQTTHAASDSRMHADLGAQYISSGAGGGNTSELLGYDRLFRDGLVVPFEGKVAGARSGHSEQQHFVAPGGLGTLCASMLSSATVVERELIQLDRAGSKPGWRAVAKDGAQEDFDAVILAVPASAALAIAGDAAGVLSRSGLSAVQYSSRWALALYYPHAEWERLEKLEWAAKYVSKQEDDALVFVAFESRKRGFSGVNPEGPVLVAHSSVPWGLANAQLTKEEVVQELGQRVNSLIGKELGDQLGEPSEAVAVWWDQSQVRPGTELGVGGVAALRLGDGAPLVLAGDGVSGSNFENCVRSATEATRIVLEGLDITPPCSL